MTVLVGGVGQLYQGDLDLGRVAVERLREEALGADVLVEELHYGAVAVAQRLEELHPDTLILIGAEARGRSPGSVHRLRLTGLQLGTKQVQDAVADAAQGYVSIDLVVHVAAGFGVLPTRCVTIEVEPVTGSGPVTELSPKARVALVEALELARTELRRAPLHGVAAEIRPLLDDGHLGPAPALTAMRELLAAIDALDADGRWGRTFSLRDRVRWAISAGETGEGMSHLDWALWWTLIEELDRLQKLEGGCQ